jgi:hypothetical protein
MAWVRIDDYHDNDHVDAVRQCALTAATNAPTVHPQVICEHGEPQ